MARYKVILAYDGTEFFGSQRQAEARTVQSVFEAALRKLDWPDQSIALAGRTDAGVHASGQVAAFDLDWNHSPEALQRALNALLPKDAAARAVTICGDDFHPRFDALERTYRYEIICNPTRDPLQERYAWRISPPPDYDILLSETNALIGIHDFAPFGGPTRPNGGTIREVLQARWERHEERLIFEVTANAFLYHMVRRMVFVLISCGHGKLESGIVAQVLGAPQDHPMFQGLAPPNGLSLVDVSYPSDA